MISFLGQYMVNKILIFLLFLETEKPLTIKVEEPLTQLSHGSSRKLDHNPQNLPAMHSRRRPLPINSPLLSSVPTPMTLFTPRLMSNFPIPRRRLDSSTTLMPLVPLNLELPNHPLSSSDNSKRKLTFTLVLLTKMLSLLILSHSWSQLFSNSPKMRSKLFSDNNKMSSFSSELSPIPILLSKKFSKRQPLHTRERFSLPMLELLTKSKVNSLNSWELLKRISQPSEPFFQLT
jgi:hypothetical protein